MADVARGQHDALRLAGRTGRIDDGDGIRLCEFRVPVDARAGMGKYHVEQILWRRLRPLLQNAIAQRCVATADERGRAVFHHGHQLRGRLARIKRNHDHTFRHQGQVERDPLDAVVRQQGAAVAFLQTARRNKGSGLADQIQSSRAVTEPDLPSRSSWSTVVSLAASSWAKMFSRKFIVLA